MASDSVLHIGGLPQREEVWRPVVGYEGLYEVSSHGRVRSVDRITKSHLNGRPYERAEAGAIRRQSPNEKGYPQIRLSKNGVACGFKVHALVAAAFLGSRPQNVDVDHIDNDRTNNHASNLQWMPHAQNVGKRDARGATARGVRAGRVKLTEADVHAIRRAAGTMTKAALARQYGCGADNIRRIILRENWQHI